MGYLFLFLAIIVVFIFFVPKKDKEKIADNLGRLALIVLLAVIAYPFIMWMYRVKHTVFISSPNKSIFEL
jgi:amino acid permease